MKVKSTSNKSACVFESFLNAAQFLITERIYVQIKRVQQQNC